MNAPLNLNQQGMFQMKDKATTLTITSLLSILWFALHWVDEIARGIATGGVSGLGGVVILVVWLYGTLELRERRSGRVIMLLGAIFGLGVLVLHMRGAGLVGRRIANSGGIFFWVWALIALGVTSTFSILLWAQGLWERGPLRVASFRRRRPSAPESADLPSPPTFPGPDRSGPERGPEGAATEPHVSSHVGDRAPRPSC